MKLTKWAFLIALSAQSATLFAKETPKKEPESFDLFADYKQIASTRFRRPHDRHRDKLSFAEGRLLAAGKHFLSEKKGLVYGIGYLNTHVGFDRHQHDHHSFDSLHHKTFNNVLLSIGGFAQTSSKWHWSTKNSLQLNTAQLTRSQYMLFNTVVQGKYQWSKKLNVQLGVWGLAGMHYNRVLPIFGFEYVQSKKMKYNAIFPYGASAIYSLNNEWSLTAAIRQFFSRQRLGNGESKELKRGLIAYRNTGAEIGLGYSVGEHFFANIHVGESFSGRLRMSRRDDSNRHHFKLRPAPYFGFSASFLF